MGRNDIFCSFDFITITRQVAEGPIENKSTICCLSLASIPKQRVLVVKPLPSNLSTSLTRK